ncbi:MAG TPA: hypothetical protein VII81_04330, partial [Terriglobales bacterium]
MIYRCHHALASPRVRSECLGHFWRAPVGQFSRAPKDFHDLNYTQNWLPFLKGEKPAPPPIEGAEEANWRFRVTSIILLVFATALALYFMRGRTLFP